ncbi:hypothetical protein [Pedobacter metabolipauper]|uniref:Uncharacterized protein n=1 Tax=Pedobacter metabolipauper TaxID=425513 RepID=A0A4R6SYN4_9SPHI|nr:hypothetical protein [Pedobacter metabolipauper]TDQ09615.1 hypothetical protein ATK78_1771 [Pedobacter metabolipauper]
MKITDDELTQLLKGMELEEPSMSFTRNIMEQVKLEIPPVSLKTKVDYKVIYGIAAVFLTAIIGIFIYALANADFNYALPKMDLQVNIQTEKILTSTALKAFLFVDLVIALIYLDSFLRRKKTEKA